MKLLVPFLLGLCCTLAYGIDRDARGKNINLHRLVHFPESFDAAKDWCQSVNGNLLQLKNVKEVMQALGNSMQGNAEEFRIDGYSEGTWYHRYNKTLISNEYPLLGHHNGKTLTLNVQDGRVSGDTEKGTRIGFICEGSEGLTDACAKESEDQMGTGDSSGGEDSDSNNGDSSDTSTGGEDIQGPLAYNEPAYSITLRAKYDGTMPVLAIFEYFKGGSYSYFYSDGSKDGNGNYVFMGNASHVYVAQKDNRYYPVTSGQVEPGYNNFMTRFQKFGAYQYSTGVHPERTKMKAIACVNARTAEFEGSSMDLKFLDLTEPPKLGDYYMNEYCSPN